MSGNERNSSSTKSTNDERVVFKTRKFFKPLIMVGRISKRQNEKIHEISFEFWTEKIWNWIFLPWIINISRIVANSTERRTAVISVGLLQTFFFSFQSVYCEKSSRVRYSFFTAETLMYFTLNGSFSIKWWSEDKTQAEVINCEKRWGKSSNQL